MSNQKLLDEFVFAVPVSQEEYTGPPRTGGVFLYQAMLLSASPVNFGDHTSREVTDPSGNQLYIPFSAFYGTPTGLAKASEAALAKLLQEMYKRDQMALKL
jgi:hypothetical protein